MNAEQEIQLSDDLRHLVAGHSFQGDPDALLQRAQRVRRRNLATRGVAGIGVLAVAATGTALGLHGGGNSGAPAVADAAFVAKQVSAALDADASNILRITDLGAGTVTYIDQTTQNQHYVSGTGDNRVMFWDSFPVIDHQAHLRDTAVNYKDHTYSTDDEVTGQVQGTEATPLSFTTRVKQNLKNGSDKVIGTGEYQGHTVIKLAFAKGRSGYELWVDSTTYQPVHEIVPDADGQPDAVDVAFLPRTPDQVKQVGTPQIPAGFTKVADASGDVGHGG
ncbi:MAG TPA: hypothetical protein VJ914_24860 [Pseudonocardiaceae bacterium]|nr:hypothetical protein [Pseudonocardiaceae bacterium]